MRPAACALALVLALAAARPARAAGPDVERAIGFILAQRAKDGSFGKTNKVAITAMCGLALLASGTTPTEGPLTGTLRDAIAWTLSRQRQDGAFVDPSDGYSAIHNHGYALTLLAECYGMTGLDETENARLRRAIQAGIRVTVASQTANGGFSYFLYDNPDDPATAGATDMWRDDEASTTVSQVQALRAARNAGFAVPGDAIARALDYLARCQHETGGFIYSLAGHKVSAWDDAKEPSFAVTAASLCALQALGRYREGAVERG
ncbi:MAG TPA: prenyltransferase/squalene oxidase repeat-containing protein, partial [Planctomycetota bacterium]|nr:prenyltransferase/squalene oxidase repeat-containing protein [Planctomycetota bacterium]